MRDVSIVAALHRLCPNANWYFKDEERYENLCWTDKTQQKPTKEQLLSAEQEIIAERNAVAYKNLRAKEYPPIADYLDAVVKGDQVQLQAYIAACQAVKAKYPKPE